MDYGKLTVIVPIYNMEEYIRDSVGTIQRQTYSNLEIILVDDGSTDSSGEICEMLGREDRRVRVFHQKNQGSMRARDLGIAKSEGKFITFFDGDDWIEENMYEEMLSAMGNVDMITSGALREEADGSISRLVDGFDEGYYIGDQLEWILSRSIFNFDTMTAQVLRPDIWDKIYRADIMKQILPYQEYSPRNGQDLLLLYRYLLRCKSMIITHKCYYHYHYRLGSTVNSKSEKLLIDLSHVYLGIKNDIELLGDRYNYLMQLQKWIGQWMCGALGTKVGFMKEALPLMFVPNISDLAGKRIVLYGAGNCGVSYYNYFRRVAAFGDLRVMDWPERRPDPVVVGWVDQNPGVVMGYEVKLPDTITKMKYDCIVICICDKVLANKVKKNLIEMGVDEKKIYWEYPMGIM